jgi:hypothetical protein
MLRYLGVAMAYHRPSGIPIPGLLWCASYHPSHSFCGAAHFCGLALLAFVFSVSATITLVDFVSPGASMLSGEAIVRWVSLSVGLNVIVTSMICFRILRMRTIVREVLSPEMSRMYTSIVAMLIESAAPFSILGIGIVVTAVLRVPPVLAFAHVWAMFCVESHSFRASLLGYQRWILLNCVPLPIVSLSTNDHPPGRHGPCVAQGDRDRDQYGTRVRRTRHVPRAKSGGIGDRFQSRRRRIWSRNACEQVGDFRQNAHKCHTLA